MTQDFRYRLLRGRGGVRGHVRGDRDGDELILRGLAPGEEYQVYFTGKSGTVQAAFCRADGQGSITHAFSGAGWYFAAQGERVILWEDGDNHRENYLQACSLLARERERSRIQTPLPAEEAGNPPAALEEASPPEAEEGEETRNPPADIPENKAAEYTLRSPGTGENIDALPALFWPDSVRHLRVYFDMQPPFAPFDWPGWRFVRAPSPVPGCAFCVLGYEKQDGLVTRVAYALPGAPFHPPAGLRGYRYTPGKRGAGYWVLVQNAGV